MDAKTTAFVTEVRRQLQATETPLNVDQDVAALKQERRFAEQKLGSIQRSQDKEKLHEQMRQLILGYKEKTAWGGTYYHGAPTKAEESILQMGLQANRGGTGASEAIKQMMGTAAQPWQEASKGNVSMSRSKTLARIYGIAQDRDRQNEMIRAFKSKGPVGLAQQALNYQPLQIAGETLSGLRMDPHHRMLAVQRAADVPANLISRASGSRVGNTIRGLLSKFGEVELAEDGVHKLQGHINFQGLDIAVENRKGSVRKGTTPDGHKWRTVMKVPYGYFTAPAKAKDGESVDVFVGPKKDADAAFVVHQHKPNGKGHDEDKVILGVRTEEEAKKLYLNHYDQPQMLGDISEVPMERLKEQLGSGKKLEKISASALRSRLVMEPYLHGASEMPGFVFRLGDREIGRTVLKSSARTGFDVGAQIQGMELEPEFRGMGLGRKIYGEMMRRIPSGTLHSDVSVSPAASSSWKKMMQSPSYPG